MLSGVTEELVFDQLPVGAWLTDLGTHQLRDVARPERVTQLCHPDLRNEFPPLRVAKAVAPQRLPAQFTSFVGRGAEITEVRRLLAEHRLVTLTGAGGAGKTRLAIEVAGQMMDEFGDGVWYVDLAPITHPDLVPVTVARAFGLPDQPGSSAVDTLVRFIGDRPMLLVLDNCEHLADACAAMAAALLGACPAVTLLATSREPIRAAGEITWGVPSLSLDDEAIELFIDRARQVRPDFVVTDDNAATVTEICLRLDGMPLAIELAAARIRALSPTEIVDSLHDRFRLLTGGARTAVRRQQTLRASVDWSHALLTEPEQVLFRRLSVFMGGFDLDAAQAVCGGHDVERYQVSISSPCSSTSRLWWPNTSRTGRDTACWRRCASTRWRSSANRRGGCGAYPAPRLFHGGCGAIGRRCGRRPGGAARSGRSRNRQPTCSFRLEPRERRDRAGLAAGIIAAGAVADAGARRGRVGLAGDGARREGRRQCRRAASARARARGQGPSARVCRRDRRSLEAAEQALTLARELGDPALLVRALVSRGSISAYDAECRCRISRRRPTSPVISVTRHG